MTTLHVHSASTRRPARAGTVLRALACALPLCLAAPLAGAAEQGVTDGTVAFNGFKGESFKYEPGVTVWRGTWLGVSLSDKRKGILHGSAWECDGEVVNQDGTVLKSDGFCRITDPDGDSVNLLWERTDMPGPATALKTKGTYLSGTGKYKGIQGHYFFTCRLGGILCTATGGDYRIP